MLPTVLSTYNGYKESLNGYIEEQDMASAARTAKKMLSIVEAQLVSEKNASYIDYLKREKNQLQEFLSNISLGIAVKNGSNSSSDDSDDKIKSTNWFSAEPPKLTLNDVAGLDRVKDEILVNVFAPLSPKYSAIYHKYRKDMGLQLLLFGPPGTGKTHIVKCIAGQLGCKIAVVQIKDVMDKYVGQGAKIISEVFEQAKNYDKCIIFFDEIDAIAASRDDDESRHTKEQLTTLLTNMDGFTASAKPNQIRIIIAATNRPWALDSAVKRGGRFDTQIYIPLPDLKARERLVEMALGKDVNDKNRLEIPCDSDVTVRWVAELLDGYAGADIKSICRQASNKPMRREINSLSKEGVVKPDCIRRSDFLDVYSKYINSITDEMLFRFDAYSMNMEYEEYMIKAKDMLMKRLQDGETLQKHEIAYLRSFNN